MSDEIPPPIEGEPEAEAPPVVEPVEPPSLTVIVEEPEPQTSEEPPAAEPEPIAAEPEPPAVEPEPPQPEPEPMPVVVDTDAVPLEEQPPADTDIARKVSQRASVQFAQAVEANNDPDLENQYEDLMGTEQNSEQAPYYDNPVEPELVDAQPMENKHAQILEPTGIPLAQATKDKRRSLADQIEEKRINPEDIFNEIQVARDARQEEVVPSQNLHSYIISKTFSSENVVVLLNLRRLKDGEWILDKTIAQGLRPETYGGVVSIDQYGPSEQSIKISRPPSKVSIPKEPLLQDPELTAMLKRIEDFIQQVNRKVDYIQNPQGRCPSATQKMPLPTCENPNFVPYEEMSFMDKFVRMLNALSPEDSDPCSVCTGNEVEVTADAISNWVETLVGVGTSLTLFPPAGDKPAGEAPVCAEVAPLCAEDAPVEDAPATTGNENENILEDGAPSKVKPAGVSKSIIDKSKSLLEQMEHQKSMLIAQSKALLDKVESHKSALIQQSKALLEQIQSTKTALMQKISSSFLPASKPSETELEGDGVPIEVVKSEDGLDMKESKDDTNIPSLDAESEKYEIDIQPQEELDKVVKDLQKEE